MLYDDTFAQLQLAPNIIQVYHITHENNITTNRFWLHFNRALNVLIEYHFTHLCFKSFSYLLHFLYMLLLMA